MKSALLLSTLALLAAPQIATAHEFGFAGILSASNMEELPEITLSVGKPLTEEGPFMLKSGTGYELEITSDGTGELALEGPGFFRAIWINEVVVNKLEIRPYGVESLEFDDAGTMELEFIAIKPGQYFLRIPGSSGESQQVEIVVQ